MKTSFLQALFEPESVAVVGASSTKGKTSYFLLKNILDGGYQGKVYPVNPHVRKILGCKSYKSVLEIPEAVDLAFLVISHKWVEPVLSECARKKVKAALIVTSGFAEIGKEGAERQRRLAENIRTSGIRVLGPNSVGMVNADHNLVGSFVPFRRWPHGPVAMASQSGIFAGAYADELAEQRTQRIGFSKSVCFGNKIDVDEVDFLQYAAQDRATKVIALHLESFKRARQFLSLAKVVKQTKPIVVLKTGRTEEGARVAASHTGSLAAPDRLVEAALRQHGVVRAETLEEFKGILKAFAWQPLPQGKRVGIITFSGALGVMAVDEMKGTGLELTPFSPSTVRAIARLLPDWQSVQNPSDVWMSLGSGARQAHEQILGAALADPHVDMLLCILLAIPNEDFAGVKEVFAALARRNPHKPLFLMMVGGHVRERWLRELEDLRIPDYSDARSAVRAMKAMWFYAERCSSERHVEHLLQPTGPSTDRT